MVDNRLAGPCIDNVELSLVLLWARWHICMSSASNAADLGSIPSASKMETFEFQLVQMYLPHQFHLYLIKYKFKASGYTSLFTGQFNTENFLFNDDDVKTLFNMYSGFANGNL